MCYAYYTFAAATAGTNPSSGSSSYDICPAGWRLPTQAEAEALKSAYPNGSSSLGGNPFNAVLSGAYAGDFFTGSFRYDTGGIAAQYWTATAYSSSHAYRLYVAGSTSVGTEAKFFGMAIRCIAK